MVDIGTREIVVVGAVIVVGYLLLQSSGSVSSAGDGEPLATVTSQGSESVDFAEGEAPEGEAASIGEL